MNYSQDDVDYVMKLARITYKKIWKQMPPEVRPYVDEEGLESAAYYGAARALNYYQEGSTYSFRNYAIHGITQAILAEERSWNPSSRRRGGKVGKARRAGEEVPAWSLKPLSLDSPVIRDEEDATLEDVIPDLSVDVERCVLDRSLREHVYSLLPNELAVVVDAYYWEGLDQYAIAKRMGISPESVRKRKWKAIRMLRQSLKWLVETDEA